jgi:hypothetical protein
MTLIGMLAAGIRAFPYQFAVVGIVLLISLLFSIPSFIIIVIDTIFSTDRRRKNSQGKPLGDDRLRS